MISRETIITGCMVYLSVGSMIWLILDGLGVIDNTFAARNRSCKRAMVLATIFMIFGWPMFVFSWVKGMVR